MVLNGLNGHHHVSATQLLGLSSELILGANMCVMFVDRTDVAEKEVLLELQMLENLCDIKKTSGQSCVTFILNERSFMDLGINLYCIVYASFDICTSRLILLNRTGNNTVIKDK